MQYSHWCRPTSLQCVLRSDVARLYRRISKRLAVETTSLYCSCFITPSHHSCSLATPDYRSCSSLLKSTYAISIDFAEMHADHIVSSGSPHNNVLHFSSIYMWPQLSRNTLNSALGMYTKYRVCANKTQDPITARKFDSWNFCILFERKPQY